MTHRGPFQPLPFCDSVILPEPPWGIVLEDRNPAKNCKRRRSAFAGLCSFHIGLELAVVELE